MKQELDFSTNYNLNNSINILLNDTSLINEVIKEDLIFSNIYNYDKNINYLYFIELFKLIVKYNKDYIENNLYKFIDVYNNIGYFFNHTIYFCIKSNIDLDKLLSDLKNNKVKVNYNELTHILVRTGNYKLVKKYIDYLTFNNKYLIEFKSYIHDFKSIKFINNIMDNNSNLIIEEIVNRKLNLTIEDLKKEKIYDFLKEIIKELVINENVSYHDVEFIGEGAASSAYVIGNKVLKIGDERITFNIDNNKRFLKPLYRQNIMKLNNEFMFCIEITEKVDVVNLSANDLYKVYKSLSDDGYFWLDSYIDNIGRLIRDNNIYFDGIDYVSKEATGYLTDNDKVLKAGDLVIIDNDYIYKRTKSGNIPKIPFTIEDCSNIDFELRYQKEKRRK